MAIHGWLFFLLSFCFVGICECDVMFLHVDLFEYKYIYHHRIPKKHIYILTVVERVRKYYTQVKIPLH